MGAVVLVRSVGGAVTSTVPVGMSATIKPRAGRLRITHESAPCSSNRIPTRFRPELRSPTSPRGSAVIYTPLRACPRCPIDLARHR